MARLLAAASALVLAAGAVAGLPTSAAASAQDLVLSGWHDYQAGALPRAQQEFLDAAQDAPTWATPAVWLAAVLVARGDRTQAAEWFQAALARHPTMAEAGYATAWLARLGVSVSRPRWQVDTLEGLAGFVHATNASLTFDQARWVANALRTAGAREGVDVTLLTSVLYIESRFNHQSISSAGAMGLGQLMPGTAAGLGVDPRDPWENVVGAARLLHEDISEFHSVALGLAAYNAGSGAVERWGGIPPYPETQWYVWAVLWVRGGLS
jgi:soluble lytic murein transglycosylase-like protein